MASRALWTEDEIAVLEEHIGESHWLDKVARCLPDRTRSAIHGRMMKLRAELNLADRHDDMGYYNANAINGSRALLEALKRIAA